jgi:hypothetical protein
VCFAFFLFSLRFSVVSHQHVSLARTHARRTVRVKFLDSGEKQFVDLAKILLFPRRR